MNYDSLALLAPSLFLLTGTLSAQTSVPAALQGLPAFAPIPYSNATGALGPFFDVVDPVGDADLFAHADAYWADIDQDGAGALSQTGWTWTAPSLVAAETTTNGTAAMVDPWNGGHELFSYLYAHQIGEDGIESLLDLCLADPVVAIAFKHYTRTHQLATSAAWDPIAHSLHISLLTDAFTTAQVASSRGIPFVDSATIVSDRTRIQSWANLPTLATTILSGPFEQGGTVGGITEDEMSDCIEMRKGDLVNQGTDTNGDGVKDCKLYKADTSGGWFGFGAKPGFDCDDYSDAIGARLTKGKPGASYRNVYVSWELPGSGKRVGHLVTRVDADGKYWLVDAQSGESSPAHDTDDAMDAGEVAKPSGYNIEPDTMKTGGTSAPNDRSDWQGRTGSGEPEAWNTDSDARDHFEEKTQKSADDFTL